MSKTLVSFVVAASLLLPPVAAQAYRPDREAGHSALAAWNNLWYTPAKVVVAAVGLPVGAIAGFLTGGDTRAAYAFWVPMCGGSYFVTPDQIDDDRPYFDFVGDEYADHPSTYGRTHHGNAAYEAGYIRR